MNSQDAVSAYKQSSIESAPPLKLVHMMYEGALRFLDQAQTLDPRAQGAEFDERLRRADAIVSELRICLNHEVAPDLCKELTALYFFVQDRIHQALSQRDPGKLDAAREVLLKLLDGWKAVEVQAE